MTTAGRLEKTDGLKERILQPTLASLLMVAVSLGLAACSKPAPPNATDSPRPSPEVLKITADGGGQPKSETTPDRQPPTLTEAQDALKRVYNRAVFVDAQPSATFVTGDFNGDGSADIAIVVSPATDMLAEINSEFANWIVADPKNVSVFDPKKAVQPLPAEPGPVRVRPGDTLLAIIHGHGTAGWRDRQATQSYLLRNAAGKDVRVIPLKNFPPALKVKERGANSRADIISQTMAGKAGFLYWAAGKYAWHER
jgi:hypothetical protein